MDTFLKNSKNTLMFKLRRENKRPCLELVKAGNFELEIIGFSFGHHESILNLRIDRVIYERLHSSVSTLETIINNEFSNTNFEDIIIINTKITPIYETFVDWDAIRGVETKSSLISKVNEEKEIMLSYVGLETSIPEEDYIQLHRHLINVFRLAGVDYIHSIENYIEMYNYLREVASGNGSWGIRRSHIEDLYSPVLKILHESYDDEAEVGSGYIPTGWTLIDENINLMLASFANSTSSVEYVGVGNMLRDILLESAKLVYIEELHHPTDFPGDLSPSDYPRMLSGYFEHKYPGRSNKQYRDLSKKTTDLAHKVTHSCDTKNKLSIAVEATLFLVRLLKLTDEN